MSNDCEAQFKTLQYEPVFPDRFGSLADARAFCEQFFAYYNHEHRHSDIGVHTPASMHHGTAREIRVQRAVTLDAAYAAHPDRFRRRPVPPQPADRRLDQSVQQRGPHPEQLTRSCLSLHGMAPARGGTLGVYEG